MRLSLVLTSLILLGVLSACGQKGDLYLPDKVADKKALSSGAAQAKY